MSEALRNAQPLPAGPGRTYFSWKEFDDLPQVLRDLINYSPTSVGTGYVYRQLREGWEIEHIAIAAVKRWRSYARRDALRLYGPDHPQAANA